MKFKSYFRRTIGCKIRLTIFKKYKFEVKKLKFGHFGVPKWSQVGQSTPRPSYSAPRASCPR